MATRPRWFARAVQENGGGIVPSRRLEQGFVEKARGHLSALGYGAIVQYKVSEAVQALRETAGPFDLIFMDIDKHGYPAALPVIAEKLRPGGVLIVDNMLWSGKVLDAKDHSKNTAGHPRAHSARLRPTPAWTGQSIPVRDGVSGGKKGKLKSSAAGQVSWIKAGCYDIVSSPITGETP